MIIFHFFNSKTLLSLPTLDLDEAGVHSETVRFLNHHPARGELIDAPSAVHGVPGFTQRVIHSRRLV
jgi:hypothetical protein